eukprot:CAMPEP_0168600164 /NCGR_PEP_ID=MMETSP0420-20121227/12592_1 /TAXON_ID=498008 /ORGANISM="Pessonella sp." /LENGTH=81 /DNA_ID=CAMNT_0008638145 /DNA_START=45 /DNA_END=286 /DNA_ORIENTATION=-
MTFSKLIEHDCLPMAKRQPQQRRVVAHRPTTFRHSMQLLATVDQQLDTRVVPRQYARRAPDATALYTRRAHRRHHSPPTST